MKPLFAFHGLLLFICLNSCNNSHFNAYNTADSTFTNLLEKDSIKLVKTAGINVKVKDARQSIAAISRLAGSLGGSIYHQNLQSDQNQTKELKISADSIMVVSAFTIHADINVKIPASRLEIFIDSVLNLSSVVINSRFDVDDKTLEYLSNELKQQNRIQILNAGKHRNIKVSEAEFALEYKDQITDQEIAKRQINKDVQYATVNLNLTQNPVITRETLVNYCLSDYNVPFNQSLKASFLSGWEGFLKVIIVLIQFWVFLVLLLITLLCYRYFLRTH